MPTEAMVDTKRVAKRRELHFHTLADVLRDVEQLAAVTSETGESICADGNWTSAQIVEHVTFFIDGAIDGFSQILGGSQRITHFGIGNDRDHDDRDVAQLGIRLQLAKHGPAVLARHHHVEGDEQRPDLPREAQSRFAVCRTDDPIAIPAQGTFEQRARVVVVIDDQYRAG